MSDGTIAQGTLQLKIHDITEQNLSPAIRFTKFFDEKRTQILKNRPKLS